MHTTYIHTLEKRTFSAFNPLMKGDCSVPAVKMTRSDWYAYSAPLSSISVMCCAETFFTDVCSVILIPLAFSDLKNGRKISGCRVKYAYVYAQHVLRKCFIDAVLT